VIVHTRNIGTLEYLIVAAAAGVPGRIHGEHGRDVYELDGCNHKYNLLRKTVRPFASGYTAVSQNLAQWLVGTIGVATDKVTNIYNGVDAQRFHPRNECRPPLGPVGFVQQGTMVVGTVGRMQTVKDQVTLTRAFVHVIQSNAAAREKLRLVMIGDGPLREECLSLLRAADAEELAWLPGERSDIPEALRAFDLFVLPSISEGISNTILEAMATGLPVIATNVGGNPELVVDRETGFLVPPSNPVSMAEAIGSYLINESRLARHGQAARRRAETRFSMEAMVHGYLRVYDEVLGIKRRTTEDRGRSVGTD
jgi:sugar transferase (PEP-CTERM/EpsH1 system associated)